MVKCPHTAAGCNYPEGDCPGHCLVDSGLRQHRPEALRLADLIERYNSGVHSQAIVEDYCKAAAELRRLQTENEDFRVTCDHLAREDARQIGEIVALKEKLDDLLVALRIAAVAAEATVCNVKWVARHCRSAIAKAEGEKS